MKKRWGFFILVFLLGGLILVQGQVRISDEIQPSKIVTANSHKLFLVDFWATWCAPCISAKKYLGVIQKQFPEDLYILSISNESPGTVRKFLTKHPSDLAIAIDYDKETFGKHQIKSLPNAILFSGQGELLWQGHPSNLNNRDILRFVNQNNTKVKRSDFIELKSYKKITETQKPVEDVDSNSGFVITPTENGPEILNIINRKQFVVYKGNLISIMAYLWGVSDKQVFLSPEVKNQNYELTIPNDGRTQKNLVKRIMRKLKLRYDSNSVSGEAVVLKTDNPKFWNTKQIDWGNDNPKYLIDDEQIQADNVTFDEIRYRLAFLLRMPVISDLKTDASEHDWQIHYKYYQLMKTDLLDNFGIIAEKRSTSYPVYILQKKTP
ncbi:MAG: TlpA family protein disulfide reductase [Flavobacteriaceae bacterium]|nr:TlpA family protein disulfide reductase [Flavobacteriaceae bacterium]